MLLTVDNITKTFAMPDRAEKRHVLNGVSLMVHEGDSIAVVGPSGAGKSTLLNIMGGLERPTTGKVLFHAENIADLTDRALAQFRNREVGFVFQQHHLLAQCTVLENVLVPTLASSAKQERGRSRERAMHLLERVGLADRASSFPSRLSGGEQQRVAVVRALINRPSLLLADEPTGSLDAKTASETGGLLVDLNAEEGTALIVVTHSLELAGLMKSCYRLSGGTLTGKIC